MSEKYRGIKQWHQLILVGSIIGALLASISNDYLFTPSWLEYLFILPITVAMSGWGYEIYKDSRPSYKTENPGEKKQ